MYANLKAELKLLHKHTDSEIENDPIVPVKKGAINSPTAFYSTIILRQEKYKAADVSCNVLMFL